MSTLLHINSSVRTQDSILRIAERVPLVVGHQADNRATWEAARLGHRFDARDVSHAWGDAALQSGRLQHDQAGQTLSIVV